VKNGGKIKTGRVSNVLTAGLFLPYVYF